jgi:leader peptidase (prepilin peptidase)/N-methyltransferase
MARSNVVAEGFAAWRTSDPAARVVAGVLGLGCLAATAVWLPVTLRAAGVAAALLPLWWAALVDVAERRLPNRLVLASLAAVVVTTAIATIAEGAGRAIAVSVIGGALAVSLPMLVMHLVSPAGLGFGDVKAGVALGGALGLIDVWTAVLALLGASVIGAAVGLVLRRRSLPFGPSLVAGAAVALVAARALGVTPV